MSKELAKLLAQKFIQRRDVKAIQFPNGDYVPDFKMKNPGRHGLGFSMNNLLDHLDGKSTYGHYVLDTDSHARLFVFDIDLQKTGNYVIMPGAYDAHADFISNKEWDDSVKVIENVNPRELWKSRKKEDAAARDWYKLQMKTLAHKFTSAILEVGVLGGTAAAYSGNKGIHVYGFTGDLDAKEVREGALLVLDMLNEFEPSRGQNFYRHKNLDPVHGFQNFSIEVFPKQDSLENKSLGNLVRLPLGKNQKSTDPTFFLDLKSPMAVMRPHPDPIELLKSGNPYV